MNDTNFQDLYYKLAKAELERLLQLSTLEQSEREMVNEYINQNELGLAYGVLKDAAVDADNSNEFEAQKIILSEFLQ